VIDTSSSRKPTNYEQWAEGVLVWHPQCWNDIDEDDVWSNTTLRLIFFSCPFLFPTKYAIRRFVNTHCRISITAQLKGQSQMIFFS
jgi:hypothetical protein